SRARRHFAAALLLAAPRSAGLLPVALRTWAARSAGNAHRFPARSKIGQPSRCSRGISRRLRSSLKIARASGASPRIKSSKVLPICGLRSKWQKDHTPGVPQMSKGPLPAQRFSARIAKTVGLKGPRMFECGYGAVEAALVQAYRIPAKAQGAFRARLGTLQKQELFGTRNMPGKGVALRYGPDQFHRLVFACEMLEFGISPAVVLSLVKSSWERRLQKIFRDAEDAAMKHEDAGPDDIIMHLGGAHLMLDGWSDAVPNLNATSLGKLPDHVTMWMSMRPEDPSGLPPRALITNLSMRLRAFHTALGRSYMDELRAERTGRNIRRTRQRKASKETKQRGAP